MKPPRIAGRPRPARRECPPLSFTPRCIASPRGKVSVQDDFPQKIVCHPLPPQSGEGRSSPDGQKKSAAHRGVIKKSGPAVAAHLS